MKNLFVSVFLLITTSVAAQQKFSFRELVGLYRDKSVENARKAILAKGYGVASKDDIRQMFADQMTNALLYSQADGSQVGLIFTDDIIENLIVVDSVKRITNQFPDIEAMGFKIVKQHGDQSRTYAKKGVRFIILLDKIDRGVVMAFLPKSKWNRILYK